MSFDHTVHDVFQARVKYDKLPQDADVRCCKCGTRLKTYYAEGQLYLVKCGYCDMITMVKTKSPKEAACLVGYEVEK